MFLTLVDPKQMIFAKRVILLDELLANTIAAVLAAIAFAPVATTTPHRFIGICLLKVKVFQDAVAYRFRLSCTPDLLQLFFVMKGVYLVTSAFLEVFSPFHQC